MEAHHRPGIGEAAIDAVVDEDRVVAPERDLCDDGKAVGDKRAAESGKVPPDVWTFSRVCGTFGERVKKAEGETAHPCQMPEAVLERIISVCTEPGDLVLDPFGGSGTSAAVAKRLRRDYWTSELSAAYADVIRKRLLAVPMFSDEDCDLSKLADDLGITQGG